MIDDDKWKIFGSLNSFPRISGIYLSINFKRRCVDSAKSVHLMCIVIICTIIYIILLYNICVYHTLFILQIWFQIGCCGADGPNDYLALRKALPTECRDTVTGNAFFYGCADEVTWFLEDKSRWTTNIAISIAALEVIIDFKHNIIFTYFISW